LNGNSLAHAALRRSIPPGVPIAVEGQDLTATSAGNFIIDGIDLNSPDGGILDVSVFLFQQQQMQAQGGKEGGEAFCQVLPKLLSFPIIQGMLQQNHAQVQVTVRLALHLLAPEQSRSQFFLRAEKIGQGYPVSL
jgi:hypothetical protein